MATIYPVHSREEINAELGHIRNELKNDSHNPYAYRIQVDGNIVADRGDDGELQGAAGDPILRVLDHYEMINVVVIVTRYYGRIHLGPAGLIKQHCLLLEQIDQTTNST